MTTTTVVSEAHRLANATRETISIALAEIEETRDTLLRLDAALTSRAAHEMQSVDLAHYPVYPGCLEASVENVRVARDRLRAHLSAHATLDGLARLADAAYSISTAAQRGDRTAIALAAPDLLVRADRPLNCDDESVRMAARSILASVAAAIADMEANLQ